MRSSILYFKQIPAFFAALGIVFLLEASLYLIPNLYNIDAAGPFFVYYKRNVAENTKINYDITLFGDSRSLSIEGIKKDEKNQYSMYNFSLPAAGPWYYPYFLKKYLKHHAKPKLVIWAGDPRQYLTYKTNRFHEDKKLWMEFKHRILNLFTLGELWEQYSGMELFFIMRQYLPNYFLSVRYRQGFEAFIGGRPEMIIKLKSHLTDRNKLIEDMVEKTNGQINLGDFFLAPPDAAKAELVNRIAILQHTDRNMNPLKNFLLYCKQEEIPVVILNIPQAKGINDTPFFKIVNQETKQITETFDNAIYLEFPEMDYDISLFAEAIHYNTKGNSKLNKDFTERVYPEIIKFLEKKSVKK